MSDHRMSKSRGPRRDGLQAFVKKKKHAPIGSVSVPLLFMGIIAWMVYTIWVNGRIFGVPLTMQSLGFRDAPRDVRA